MFAMSELVKHVEDETELFPHVIAWVQDRQNGYVGVKGDRRKNVFTTGDAKGLRLRLGK